MLARLLTQDIERARRPPSATRPPDEDATVSITIANPSAILNKEVEIASMEVVWFL